MSGHEPFERLAVAELDFELSADERRELAGHLEACDPCRRFAARLRLDAALARSRPRAHAPDQVREAVVAAATAPIPRWTLGSSRRTVEAAILLLGLLVALTWLSLAASHVPPKHWGRLPDVPAFEDGVVTDVIGDDGHLIAVGGIARPAEPPAPPFVTWVSAAVWTTADGRTWQRVGGDDSFAGAGAFNVAVQDNRLVVIGDVPGLRRDLPWIWHWPWTDPLPSTTTWMADPRRLAGDAPSRGPDDPWSRGAIAIAGGGEATPIVADLVASDGGFAAVGTALVYPDKHTGVAVGALVATSPDGIGWELNDPTGTAFVDGSMVGVAADHSGLVAVGSTGLDPTIWLSANGRTWTRLPDAIRGQTASVRDVAAGPNGFAAVGDDARSAVSWTSTDGRSWVQSATTPELANARMFHVSWVGSGFVATGQSTDDAGDDDGVAWWSTDGASWTRLETGPIFTGVTMQAAGAVGSHVLLFGEDSTGHVVAAIGDL